MLQVMRRYMRTFFGCGECGRHFEQAAASSMDQVENKEDQILWLWDQHNRVNARLAGKWEWEFLSNKTTVPIKQQLIWDVAPIK